MVGLLLTALLASQPGDFVRRHIRLNQIRICYQDELMRSPTLEARVTLHLVFDGFGRAIDVSAEGAPTSRLEQCIVASARRWSLPNWEAESRRCDSRICVDGKCRSDCEEPVRRAASHQLIVTWPLLLQTVKNSDQQLHVEARACWDQALLFGADDTAAHVTRHAESDGFEVVSVEETALPQAAAVCLAHAAMRHRVADQWFWFRAP